MAQQQPRRSYPKPVLANYVGSAKELRAVLYREGRSERVARSREDWPALWAALDRLVRTVDQDFPSVMSQNQRSIF